MATLFSHFWICQFHDITGQHLHILNWPYTTAKCCGDKPSWFLGFCWMRKLKWSTNCSTNVSNLQIAKWSSVSPVLSWWFSHYKNSKNKNGLTSFHLATFPSEFTIVKMQQSCEVELVHGLTPLYLAAFLREWIWVYC